MKFIKISVLFIILVGMISAAVWINGEKKIDYKTITTLASCSGLKFNKVEILLHHDTIEQESRTICRTRTIRAALELSIEIQRLDQARGRLDTIEVPEIDAQQMALSSKMIESRELAKITLEIPKIREKLTAIEKEIDLAVDKCNKEWNFEGCICKGPISVEDRINEILSSDSGIIELMAIGYTPSSLREYGEKHRGASGYIIVDTLKYSKKSDLTNAYKKIIDDNDATLFIGIDGEGGAIQRVPDYYMPSIQSRNRLNKTDLCKALNKDVEQLSSLGVNWNLAPVLDISQTSKHWIYPRTISSDPNIASRIGAGYIGCLEEAGIATTAKHFPGHGGTAEDSHLTIPVIDKDLKSWRDYDKKPFQAAVDADVDFIMTGHLSFPAIDSEIATFSKYWMEDVLRKEMKFTGLIVTDDLNMLAPRDSQTCARNFAKAINAGADIGLYIHNSRCDTAQMLNHIEQGSMIKKETVANRLENIYMKKAEISCN